MNGKWTKKFASCQRLTVNVSLNAASPETYRLLSQRDEFDRIIENIKRLIQLRNGTNRNSSLVVLSFVAIKENIAELPDFVRLAAQLGVDKVIVQDLILLNQGLRKHSLTPYAEFAKSIFLVALNTAREVGVKLIPFVPVHFFPTDSDSFEENGKLDRKKSVELCIEPWIYLRIAMDGGVQLCCYSNENMGNLHKQSLTDIWNGEKFRHYRTRVNSSDPPEDCRKCPKKVGMSL
jgi:radical SAM protein with 4Fe4S-binding SPASM domain